MAKVVDLFTEDGVVYATSRQVAKDFGKKHSEVLYAIEGRKDSKGNIKNHGLLNEIGGISQVSNYFVKSTYKDSMNRTKSEYKLTKDGFTLLAMGFTGANALQFKVDYIYKFNQMEAQLKEIDIVMNSVGELTEEEYAKVKFSTAQRVRKTFLNSLDIFKDYERFINYSRKSLTTDKRETRLNQIIDALKVREDELYRTKQKGYRAERENIIELTEVILRDITELNKRSYGQKVRYAKIG
ncbi:Rha family transcriptional regulator [Heyndrickxia sp. FSL K6-6286]|uniref:Rha family transcriptional regulator n=1 Tax=Heyndrickxia sp. FSL K6-6286 TaxID=2921510 RepID=UPI00315A8EA9